jgi:glutaminyl-peptide cyclotransferase
MRFISGGIITGWILLMICSCCKKDNGDPDVEIIPVLGYSCPGSYPHDTTSFTEGLLVSNDSLFESTGSPSDLPQSRSVFGPVDLTTGKINVRVDLDEKKYFGEGIAFLDGKFYQLTYKNQIGFVYDAGTYEKVGQFSFLSEEGWGLTTDGESLIMSDGTDKLSYLDPETFLLKKILSITEKGSPKSSLNELEYVQGFIYANVWLTNTIVKIDPSSGKVVGILDLTDLVNEAESLYPGSREMNGIAIDPGSGRIFITGKLWPRIFELTFIP